MIAVAVGVGIGRVNTTSRNNGARARPSSSPKGGNAMSPAAAVVRQCEEDLGHFQEHEAKRFDTMEKMGEDAARWKTMASSSLAAEAAAQSPATDAGGGGLDDAQQQQKRVDCLPDMTGKIITVSAKETLKLTKDPKKRRGRGGAGAKKKKDSHSPPEEDLKRSEKDPGAGMEKEFHDFIAKLSLAKEGPWEDAERGENGDGAARRPPEAEGCVSDSPEVPCEVHDKGEDARKESAFVPEYTLDTAANNVNDAAISVSKLTVDYTSTLDTSSKTGCLSSRRKSDLTIFDLDTTITAISESAAVSESVQDSMCGKTSEANDTVERQVETVDVRLRRPFAHRVHQSHLRSSLRRGGGRENEDLRGGCGSGRPEYARGISWATLIDMDTDRKTKKKSNDGCSSRRASKDRHQRSREKSQTTASQGGSQSSVLTPDSRVSGTSRRSGGTRNSGGSCGSKKSSVSSNTVSWKDESALTMSSCGRDPQHVRRQARERFDRGVHYAEGGKLEAARERFLTALRYRVMRRGPHHPDVAAAHEMLGHVNFFLGEQTQEEEEEELEKGPVRLGERTAPLGWDSAMPGKALGKGEQRGNAYLEKAAMHYRTVLQILGGGEPPPRDKPRRSAADLPRGSMPGRRGFRWSDAAKSYGSSSGDYDDDGGDESSPGMGRENRLEIVARVHERLSSLPATANGKWSYATTFLDS